MWTAHLFALLVSRRGVAKSLRRGTSAGQVWFGVGFNARAMQDNPWAVIVDGHGNVRDPPHATPRHLDARGGRRVCQARHSGQLH